MKNRSRIAIQIKCIGVIVSTVFMASAHAASFDCARATSFSEKAVCGDAALSLLDDTLAARYASAYAVAPDKRALAAVRDHEWHWRQTHCRDKTCVADWYGRRIAELTAEVDRNTGAESAVAARVPSPPEPVPSKTTQNLSMTASRQVDGPSMRVSDPSEIEGRSATTHRARDLPPLSNGPLPPDLIDRSGSVSFIETGKKIDSAGTTDVLPLPPGNWTAPAPVLSQAARPKAVAGYRLFNKGERTSARTVGIFVGF